MSIEDAIAAGVAAQLHPLAAEVVRLTRAVEQLQLALPLPLATISDAAKHLGVSVSTIRRGIKRGEIPVRRIGCSVRVDLAALRPMTEEQIAQQARAARERDPA